MTSDRLHQVLSNARAVLFDFDGPICSVFAGRPAPSVAHELRLLLQNDGHTSLDDLSEDDPLEVLRNSERFGPATVQRIEDALTDAELDAIKVAAPTPGGAQSLENCVRGSRLAAVVTNNSEPAVAQYLAQHGISELVHEVVGRAPAEPRRMKPSPDSVRRALSALAIDAGNVVLVGDSPNDLAAAHASGVPSIGFANKPRKVDTLAAAAVLIEDMAELAVALQVQPIGSAARGR